MAKEKAQQNTELTTTTPQVPQAQENASERFAARVIKEFGSSVAGAMEVTDFNRRLIQGYFIMIDRALKTAEDERVRKNAGNKDHKYDNPIPVTWDNVNMRDLALDVVHFARMGLDMQQPAMLYPIPYKNNKTGRYDMTLMPGYNGIKYVAKKYAQDKPTSEIIELVYDSDTFRPHIKDSAHPVTTYEFTINNPFDRGQVIGGFGYLAYDDPSKNELIMMSKKDIEKRKPAYASANFWGGEQTVWKNGEKTTETKEGWYEEMCRKTLIREVYGGKHLPLDPQKIDDNYQYMKIREAQYAEMQAQAEIEAAANTIPIDTDVKELPEPTTPPMPEKVPQEPAPAPVAVDQATGEVIGASQDNLFDDQGPSF